MNAYASLLEEVVTNGWLTAPRGLETRETSTRSLTTMAHLPYSTAKFNPAIAAVEALCLLAGETDRDALSRVAPKTVERGYFNSRKVEYGERVVNHEVDQLALVVDALRSDSDTRQAVLVLVDSAEPRTELPCVLAVQFKLSSGHRLELEVFMRSWDLVMGLPYDVMLWGVVAQVVARSLCLQSKSVVNFTATTPHVYLPFSYSDLGALSPAQDYSVQLQTPLGMSITEWRTHARELLDDAPWAVGGTTSWDRLPTCLKVSRLR